MNRWFIASCFVAFTANAACARGRQASQTEYIFPGAAWATRTPEKVGLSTAKLDALRKLVGGRGVVVRRGYLVYTWGDVAQSRDITSAVKPVISTLLLLAVQEGKLKGVDDTVVNFEPRLAVLNGGKDAKMTWRHLASQTSGYGLTERPGKAYSYNDYALALYYRMLTEQVFKEPGTRVFQSRVGDTLQFQDDVAFDKGKPGRLAISVRDLARFGLLYLRGGKWKEIQVLRPELVELAITSPLAADSPLTQGAEAAMLPGQPMLGGGKNQTRIGPGYYSFNWWLNRTDQEGRRLFIDAPPDSYVASGHGSKRVLWMFPSLDLIVAWNDSSIADHDGIPGNPRSKCNQAARLIRDAVLDRRQTRVSIVKDKWHINGEISERGAPAEGLLMNVRMVNAVFENRNRRDFDPEKNTDRFISRIADYAAHGVRAFTLCLQGGMPDFEGAVNSAFAPDGSLHATYLQRVRRVIEACDGHGVVVILGCYYQRQDQILKDDAAVKAGVVNAAQWIKGCGFTNVVLEIANEFPHGGFDHQILRSAKGEAELIRLAKATAPDLLVSTSGIGDGKLSDVVCDSADFLLIHFNGEIIGDIPSRIKVLRRFGKPIVCNEDDRTGLDAANAAETAVSHGASYGLMLRKQNQAYPFTFNGAADDREFYSRLKRLTRP